MAERIGAHDWAATPLGAMDVWPQCLRTTLQVVLQMRQPACLCWGPEARQLYNDEYRAILGDKHPRALGEPLAEVWTEYPDEVQTAINGTMAGTPQLWDDAAFDLARRGDEPTRGWFTASWTPVADDDGSVGGFLIVATETTVRHLAQWTLGEGEKRQGFLLELNDAMRAAGTADAIVATASRMLGERLGASRIVYADIDDVAGLVHIRQDWTAAGVQANPAELQLSDFAGPLLDDLRAGKTVHYDDVGAPPHARSDLAALDAIGVKSGLTVPHVVDGGFVANLNVHQDRPRVWADADIALAEETAERIWTAMERARAEAALRASEAKLAEELADAQILQHISSSLVEDDAAVALYTQILDGARALMHSDFASLQMFIPERNELVLLAYHGFAPESARHWQRVGLKHPTSCGRALGKGGQAIITDAEQSEDLIGTEDLVEFRRSGIRGMQSTPLVSRSGRLVGMISTHWRDVHEPGERELRLFEVVARQAADLVERQAANDALRASEEKYRTLFETMRQGYCDLELVRDADGLAIDQRYLEFNPAYERLVGIAAADAKGRTASEVMPELEPWWIETFDRIVKRGEPERVEHLVASLGRWFEGNVYPRGGDRLTVFYEDITERKRAEEVLRESENERREELERRIAAATAALKANKDLLQGTVDSSEDMIQVFEAVRDETGEIVDFRWILNNRKSMSHYGEVIGESLLERNPGVVDEGIFDTFKRVTETGLPEHAEHHYVYEQFDGWFFQSAVKFGDGVATTTKAIDEWKAAQADILRLQEEKSEAKLSESEERYRSLFESIDEGFCVIKLRYDAAGQVVDYHYVEVNPAFERQTGLSVTAGMLGSAATNIEARWLAVCDHVARTGQAERFVDYHKAIGRWYEAYVARVGAADDGRVCFIFNDVTERKRAEMALRENEERLSTIFAEAPVGLSELDVAGNFMQVNGAMAAILGRSREELLTLSISDVTHPNSLAVSFDTVARVIDTATTQSLDKNYVRPDGTVIPASSNIALLGDGSENARLLAVTVDLTERRRAEAALRASEERLRQFGEASQDVLWIRDAKTMQWVYLTPAFESIYGLSREEALAGDNYRRWQEMVVPEDRAHTVASIAKVHAGQHVTFEYRIRRAADGAIRWMRDNDFPITNAAGDIVLIGGVGHDATKLREAEQRLQTLVEGIPQLVWRAINGGEWTWASPQWTEYTGQSEVDSRGWGWLEPLHPDDRDAARQAWSHALDSGGFEVEYRIRHQKQGAWRWFQTRATPVHDSAGAIVEWLGTSTDIHDLHEMQDRQKILVAELQHRTRNLMGVVHSMADKTVRSSVDLADFRVHFHDRLKALSRVQGLLSRLEEHDRVTFDELIETELSAMGGGTERVTIEGPVGIRLRSSMVQTLAMAIHELATNAVKYGALGGTQGRLAITWSLEPSSRDGKPWLHIDWRESGVDMPLADASPQGTGQGRELIEKALPYQLGAETSYQLTMDGVYCTISVPVSQHDQGE